MTDGNWLLRTGRKFSPLRKLIIGKGSHQLAPDAKHALLTRRAPSGRLSPLKTAVRLVRSCSIPVHKQQMPFWTEVRKGIWGSVLDPYRTACEDRNDKCLRAKSRATSSAAPDESIGFRRACRNYAVSACVSLASDFTAILLKGRWKKK